MKKQFRRNRYLRTLGGTVAGWVVATLGISWVMSSAEEPLDIGNAIAFGVVSALISAWFETRAIPRLLRRTPAVVLLLIRTLFYTLVLATVVVVSAALIGSGRSGSSIVETLQTAVFKEFLLSGQFLSIVVLLVMASFVINFVRQLSRMLGQGQLARLFIGRYQTPVEESRIFMFLDIKGSTAIAEKLGARLFNSFKNDFFYDIADPVLATRGEIYQYVGDEVVVSWRVRDGKTTGNPLRCFCMIEDQIRVASSRYLDSYGLVPEFKAGFHGGKVITAEIGDLKRDIVHSGDVVNCAARIEAQCRPLGVRLLASEYVLDHCEMPRGRTAVDLGSFRLRGKSKEIRLFNVLESDSVAPVRALLSTAKNEPVR